MTCTPSDNTLNPIVKPGVPLPGFGLPFAPIQLPNPETDLPAEVIEDILSLVQQIGALFPSSVFKPNADFSMKTVLDMVMNVLSQISPFLSFYKFIMAALNMFVCIIEILCAIPNPFAIAAKLKKLFTECLPPFINLFPWVALISMVLSLLLLILALVDYIISTIVQVIATIVKNLDVLASGVQLQDAQSTLAAAQKIASLVCFIQNILAVLVGIEAIISIIQALATLAGTTICDDNDSDGCCTPTLCPAFVKNTPAGIEVSVGKLIYYNEIQADTSSIFTNLSIPNVENLITVPPVRLERWQILDTNFATATYPISNIITPVSDPNDPLSSNIFWPEPLEFQANLSLKKAPYLVDLNITLDPAQFGQSDTGGIRAFVIKNCIVVRQPYLGILDHSNVIDSLYAGAVLNLEGGLVYEADGTTPYLIASVQATLNTFVHLPATLAASIDDLPTTNDAVIFDNLPFTWKPNAPALAGYQLVTIGCVPLISAEKTVQNSIILAEGITPVMQKITPLLPDVIATQICLSDALAIFRKDISVTGAAVFQATALGCLNDLKTQTSSIVTDIVLSSVSQFKSSVSLDTDVQFTTRFIIATVILRDATGTSLSSNLPTANATAIQDKIKGAVTFGVITSFTYDGSAAFLAKISSPTTGTGQITVSFDNKIFSTVTPGNATTISSIQEIVLTYNFVESDEQQVPRRDDTDVASLQREII